MGGVVRILVAVVLLALIGWGAYTWYQRRLAEQEAQSAKPPQAAPPVDREAEERAAAEAAARLKAEAEEKVRLEAEEKARLEAEAQAEELKRQQEKLEARKTDAINTSQRYVASLLNRPIDTTFNPGRELQLRWNEAWDAVYCASRLRTANDGVVHRWEIVLMRDSEVAPWVPAACTVDGRLIAGSQELITKFRSKQREQATAARQEAAAERAKARKERQEAEEETLWRTWTDSTGKHKTEARFGGVLAGKVKLIKRDGATVELPLDKLSEEDRQWLDNRAK